MLGFMMMTPRRVDEPQYHASAIAAFLRSMKSRNASSTPSSIGGAWKVADIAAPADNWKLSELDCGGE